MLYLLNSAVLTAFGNYGWESISVADAEKLIQSQTFISAVGHQNTADRLSKLLGVQVPCSRQHIVMSPGDKALVFRPHRRLEQTRELTSDETAQQAWELGLLTRIN